MELTTALACNAPTIFTIFCKCRFGIICLVFAPSAVLVGILILRKRQSTSMQTSSPIHWPHPRWGVLILSDLQTSRMRKFIKSISTLRQTFLSLAKITVAEPRYRFPYSLSFKRNFILFFIFLSSQLSRPFIILFRTHPSSLIMFVSCDTVGALNITRLYFISTLVKVRAGHAAFYMGLVQITYLRSSTRVFPFQLMSLLLEVPLSN